MSKVIKIGLLGSGTVGTGVVRVLKENGADIAKKAGAAVVVKKVLVRDVNKKRPYLEDVELTDNAQEIVNDPEIDIVVELMGGLHPAFEYMMEAMKNGKHVVTANKDVVAQMGHELLDMAEAKGVDFRFEASVGGGIPIITPLKECLTGNRITEIMGIVNGTTNYMLTQMTEKGSDYAAVLKEAQEKGYAEANPAADVEGLDDADQQEALLKEHVRSVRQHVKELAVAKDYGDKGVNVRVHPVFLAKTHPLASVNDVFNAIFIRGNAIGDAMFYGRGAGSLPTASAVTADIVSETRNLVSGTHSMVGCTCYNHRNFCPLEETESSYYVRLHVDDEPGVLGRIATAFGESGVSLKSVIQTRKVENHAEIVAVTHVVQHKHLQMAADILNGLGVVNSIRSVIRVEQD